MVEMSKAALRAAVERFNAGDEAYYDFYADDVTVYGLPGAPVVDRAGLVEFYRGFWSGFPNARVELLELLGEDNLLAARLRISGAQENEFMGVQPDGKSISVEAMSVFRMTGDARCAERWVRLDEVSFLTQLGLMPAPATA